MTFDLINTLASLGTLAVITATAAAAIVQLRHVRTSNQIALLTSLHDTLQSPDFIDARRFVRQELPAMLRDPNVRENVRNLSTQKDMRLGIMLGNFYENVGMFVRLGTVDRTTVCTLWGGLIDEAWTGLAPLLSVIRSDPTNFAIWENFEYLATIAQDWAAQHPDGNYPPGVRRLPLPSP